VTDELFNNESVDIQGETTTTEDILKWKDGTPCNIQVDGFDPSSTTQEEVIKRMVGLRKKLAEMQPVKAPDHYEIDSERFNTEDPILKEFIDIAKDSNLSQDKVSKLLELSAKQAESFSGQYKNKYEEEYKKQQQEWQQKELEKLGPNAQDRYKEYASWLEKQGMPENVRKGLEGSIVSATSLEAMEYLMKNYQKPEYSSIPGRNIESAPVDTPSDREYQNMIGAPNSENRKRWYSDKEYQNQVKAYGVRLQQYKQSQKNKGIQEFLTNY